MKEEAFLNPAVRLVGAGPGDPDLLTLKGRDALEQADILFYDPRVPPSLLQYLPETAERVPVETGTAAEGMASAFWGGKRVVRLVPGDPWLDRGVVAEAEALAAGGIQPEPVPGIPMETAVPAYGGIPLAGDDGNWMIRRLREGETDGEELAAFPGTRILTLDRCTAQRAKEALLSAGLSPDTPVALVEKGTRMEQRVWTGRLDEVREREDFSPNLFIMGKGVSFRDRFAWFEKKPLFGRRVLITRAKGQSASMAEEVRRLGGETVEFPAIEIRFPQKREELDQALKRLGSYDWVVFTSVNGVDFFFQHLNRLGIDIRQMYRARLAAVGPKTAEVLEAKGLRVEILPGEYKAEALVEALKPRVRPGESVLLPRANIARKLLATELEACGCQVTDVDAYDTVPGFRGAKEVAGMLERGDLHLITFTSSSTVRNFVEALRAVEPRWESLLTGVRIACIGPITAQTAEDYGLQVDAVAESYTIDGLIKAWIPLP